jgi:ADP-ribose pyrophosphatase YjhB (NUDIX family)
MKYCSNCGHIVQLRQPPGDQRERFVCTSCGTIHYQNPRIVAGCIVDCGGHILLCKRAIEPRMGYWTNPAGFMELGETLQQAALRETREEALAEVRLGTMVSVTNVLHTGQVHVFFRATLAEPHFGIGAETLDARLYAESEIPWREMAFTSSIFALEKFLDDRRLGRELLHFQDLP